MTSTLSVCDAFDLLASTPESSIDLILTDPPYESLEKYRAIGTTTRLKKSAASSNAWFETIPNSDFPRLFGEFYRVLRDNRHLYLFCDSETMFVAKPMAVEAGLRFEQPLVWDKLRMGMGYHYRARYEFVLMFAKGERSVADPTLEDLLQFVRIKNKKAYPTEKPVPLLRTLIRQSTKRGEVILDSFMGSGSAGVAAVLEHRNFIGGDIATEAYERAQAAIAARTDPYKI